MTLTFESMCELVPELAELNEYVLSVRDPGPDKARSFCAHDVWYGGRGWPGVRDRLYPLVGFDRKARLHDAEVERELRTSYAWNIAYETLYDRLPNCRNCLCI